MKEVTLVITSCNRLDLLTKTIASFEKFNTYPIKKGIIIEDSGIKSVHEDLLAMFGDRYKIIFNETPLKQIGSIDRAYSHVDTEYIFHCEDDWQFYRPGFIEDSIKVLEADPKIKQVALRSIQHDYKVNHPTVRFADSQKSYDGIRCSVLTMDPTIIDEDWVTFSFTPGLLRKKDYDLTGSYSAIGASEAVISKYYKQKEFFVVVLENDAVMHIGWDDSTMGHYTDNYNFKVRFKNVFKSCINLLGGNHNYN